ncbi:DUF3606 domain-containing protein [Variovorax sp. GT1P44]|uniref:DUF3606 domain-containing protein n=1 Tax=Variovorax sp. GT1P44 TaxID=3443742 RepID=UPI003F4606B6
MLATTPTRHSAEGCFRRRPCHARPGQDRARINVNEDHKVHHWIQALGVSEAMNRTGFRGGLLA